MAVHLLKIPRGKYGPAVDLNQTRFWQLPTNYTHRLVFLERHGSEKQNAAPHQPGAELCKPLFSFSMHRSVAGIPAPLIHEAAYAGVGKGAPKNFFMKKKSKKKAAPFLRRRCYGPAGFTTDGSESHPAPGSEAVHSSIPFAFPAYLRPRRSAQGSPSPRRRAGMRAEG